MIELLFLFVASFRAVLRSRTDLVTEDLLLRQQLPFLTRPARKRPCLRGRDGLFWMLVGLVRGDWTIHLVLVRPETVACWHRPGWRSFWRWRSRVSLGRPRLSPQTRELIAAMAKANPLWGTERIRGDLLKPGIVVSKRSVQQYRRAPPRPPSQAWRIFLRNHRPQL
jgi:hypothetical protein